MKYVTYKRVSTTGQGKSGLGLEAQDRDISLFLENYSEEPWEVIGEFTAVVSGSVEHPLELKEAIALAKGQKATLLVSKLDRLSRKVSVIATLMDDKKLQLKVAQMPQADKFSLHIYAALAEQERDFISKRTKAALAEAKAKGVKLGGYRKGAEARYRAISAQADANAQRVINTIQPLREQGMTYQQIADRMTELGVKTAQGSECWYPSTVKRVLERA
ncbi:recombinase family protein [Alterinioella nitratireducens]|uniref:recombinase family protein n=1 Tax=Alterinioella nitratireducens TaxID=2735915 RepID=UPI001555637D|nr:recombinase family protein [Alterinioella nitratireducens]NPD21737.1 recombinase family protein [Alterinioella nitratireducens]